MTRLKNGLVLTIKASAVAEVVVCVLYSRASFAVDIYDSPLGR